MLGAVYNAYFLGNDSTKQSHEYTATMRMIAGIVISQTTGSPPKDNSLIVWVNPVGNIIIIWMLVQVYGSYPLNQ